MSDDKPAVAGLRRLRVLAAPLLAITVAVAVGAVLIAALGHNPLDVYGVLLEGGLSGWPNFSVTLQMTSPLLFTGLAVAIAFRAGLWNIGAEGQMLMGGLAAGIAGAYLHGLPAIIHLPLCIVAAFLGGLAWAAIPGVLRAYLAVNELVICLMLNPIALLLTGYVSTSVLKAPGPTNKLPDVVEAAVLPSFTVYSQLNAGILLGLLACLVMAVVNVATVRGFVWKLIGLNPRFAYYGGIDVTRNALGVMLVSGGVAGLAGAEQVLGVYKAFYDNFSPGFGFDGIAVAMLAQNQPVGVIAASLLFGLLNAGSGVLQMQMGLSKYFVDVLQFIIVLVLAARWTWPWKARHRDKTDTAVRRQPVNQDA